MRFGNAALAALAIGLAAHSALAAGKVCDITHYGAKGDGVTKNTAAVQKAIDDCTAGQGGGTVEVPSGTFVIGPIMLKSNLTLHLAKDATLLGSPDKADYPKALFIGIPTIQPLISSDHADNIVIDGEGIIDGNGKIWWNAVKGVKDAGQIGRDHPRPMLFVPEHSSHIRMEGITVQNSGFWQIVPVDCNDLTFRDMKVLAPRSPNTDGIDPVSSSNVVIDHVTISVGDDDIAIKSGEPESPGAHLPSTNISITDCTIGQGHGISIGGGLKGGAHNIHVERVHFKGTLFGIRIKAGRDRGNDVSNISYNDITMDGVANAIVINSYYPNGNPSGEVPAAPVTATTPKFHNITVEHMTAINSQSAGSIVGLPESPAGITLQDVHIQAKTGLFVAYAKVDMSDVTVKPQSSAPIISGPKATVIGYK